MAAVSPCPPPLRTQNPNPRLRVDLGNGFSKSLDFGHFRTPKWRNFEFKKLWVSASASNDNAASLSESTPSLTLSKSVFDSTLSDVYCLLFSGFS